MGRVGSSTRACYVGVSRDRRNRPSGSGASGRAVGAVHRRTMSAFLSALPAMERQKWSKSPISAQRVVHSRDDTSHARHDTRVMIVLFDSPLGSAGRTADTLASAVERGRTGRERGNSPRRGRRAPAGVGSAGRPGAAHAAPGRRAGRPPCSRYDASRGLFHARRLASRAPAGRPWRRPLQRGPHTYRTQRVSRTISARVA